MASVRITSWDPALFQLLPSNEPATLPPPVPGSISSAPPFSIPSSIFHAALDVHVPITIGVVFVVTVMVLNAYNRSAGNRPWKISKTRAFLGFVVAHNVFLAVYSAWTFQGIVRAVYRTVSSGSGGMAGTVDSLCKLHGEAGLGKAIAYDGTTSKWGSESPSTTSIFLNAAGMPSPTDAGRLWNEGLAFYGWIFYVSKFYEVIDTAIVIAKGKRCSTLQTYHHAGAMMCMWSGIRYMSPPIWLWVAYNSGIHTMMVGPFLSISFPQGLIYDIVYLLHSDNSFRSDPADFEKESDHDANHPISRWRLLRCPPLFRRLHRTDSDCRPERFAYNTQTSH